MSPILGIIASQNYTRITGSYDSIATVTVGTNTPSTVTFSSIPQTYTHLQVRGWWKDADGNQPNEINVQFNGNNFSSYASHWIVGNGSSATASNSIGSNTMFIGKDAGYGGGFVLDLLDYTSSIKKQTFRTLLGADSNGSGAIYFSSGFLNNGAVPIDSLSIRSTGYGFAQYSKLALYGIKGA